MGRLTGFQCPNKIYSRFVKVGSPTPTATVFPELVNHVVVSHNAGSGWYGFDFTPTNLSGLYLPASQDWQTLDVTCGSVSIFGNYAGSINIIGMV